MKKYENTTIKTIATTLFGILMYDALKSVGIIPMLITVLVCLGVLILFTITTWIDSPREKRSDNLIAINQLMILPILDFMCNTVIGLSIAILTDDGIVLDTYHVVTLPLLTATLALFTIYASRKLQE